MSQQQERPSSPTTREEQKARTRRRLLSAALDLIDDGRSFTALSLRSVAHEAGITPNAFYRHFDGMEELGLALVDDIGPTLRQLLRAVRKESASRGVIRRSVDTYVEFVRDNKKYFTFIVRERVGGSARLRAGIRRDIGYFASELAADIAEMTPPGLEFSARATRLTADLIIETMLGVATEIIDLPPDDLQASRALTDRFVDRIVLITVGAATWDQGRRAREKASAQ